MLQEKWANDYVVLVGPTQSGDSYDEFCKSDEHGKTVVCLKGNLVFYEGSRVEFM